MNRAMSSLLVILAAFVATPCMGFAPMHNAGRMIASVPPTLNNYVVLGASPLDAMDFVTNNGAVDVDALVASSSVLLSETEAWVQPLSMVLGPFLNFFSFAMLCRIVLSWYPTANVNEVPFNIIVWPTEPLLRLLKGSVPPAFGVDITPVVWLGLFSFMSEILLGQQGLLTMKMKYGI
eukprot:CAMPEP_0113392340 /NCGR_PEP_ID=MMETSP0013_2-20120614/11227_1 /TAXON_ID=2843 ORGANISM="Skeletonema costatum, Strain 1716" /NCGR_SAMPLE_ID=MMETSP0013_2 /ASSEMBLY_ACC=CAM_ASM_000158 /LENGTH=177 /DNA_ID=CAMNT_0000275715 /DNA_START=353 /DNA_END=886 /DNA_ORIENTATION=- /assembly_acc=CAM_ASM_000158